MNSPADTAFQLAITEAHAAFDRAKRSALRELESAGGRQSTYAAAIVDAYAAFDRARAEAHAASLRSR